MARRSGRPKAVDFTGAWKLPPGWERRALGGHRISTRRGCAPMQGPDPGRASSRPLRLLLPADFAPAAAAAAAPAAAPAPAMSPAKEAIVAARIIEEMRPVFHRDGGDVELVDMEGSLVLVHMTGACAGCQIASLTLGGLQKKISEALGRAIRVMPVAKT